MTPWRCVSVGLMEYRRGRYPAAIAKLERCLAFGPGNPARTATALVVLAMSRQQTGETKLAALHLAEAREAIETKFASQVEMGDGGGGYWFDWLLARVLMQEAVQLIQGR
jgi:hypothetical protein